MDERTIENLDDVEELLKTRLSEVSYVAIAERRGGGETQLARLDLPELSEWANASTWGEKAGEALEWVRKELLGIADGPRSSFRVAVFGGSGRILMRTCVVLDSQAALHPIGSPVEEAMAEVGAQGVFQLGSAWKQFTNTVMDQTRAFGAMCLKQMEAVDKISRAQTELTAKETASAREQVNKLVGEVTKAKIGVADAKAALKSAEAMAEVDAQRKEVEAQQSEVNRELAKGALDKVGEFGQALLMSKTGMTTEMADVASALQGHPEMMEALKDPKIREQLKNPDNISYIAASLKQAVAVTVAQEAMQAAEDAKTTEDAKTAEDAAPQETPASEPSGETPSE